MGKRCICQYNDFDDAKWAAFVANPSATALQADPAFAYASAFVKNYNLKYAPYILHLR